MPSAVWYVNDDAAGANTGTSWADAFRTLQPALTASQPGDQVWVADGTYQEATPFALRDGVSLYGGFSGTEQTLGQRDFRRNVTTLSGGNAHTVVTASAFVSARLDGFTITGGRGSSRGPGSGGVHVSSGATVALANLSIAGNIGDTAGGLSNSGNSTVTLSDVSFSNNVSDRTGGGMLNAGTATLTNVRFVGNGALTGGGGLQNGGTLTLTNGTFFRNVAGALSNSGQATLTNVTSTQNQGPPNSPTSGATFFLSAGATFTNCVLWGDGPTEIATAPGVTAQVSYSVVQGGYPGTGNINPDYAVRRAKVSILSGCNSHPAKGRSSR